jgi:V8-like Glu-specific endopeptidase
MPDFSDRNANISIFGYPQDQPQIVAFETKTYGQYGHGGHQIKYLKNGVLYHTIDTVGQSGSPVLVKDAKGNQYAIGIHKAALKGKYLNVGTLLTA